MGAHLLSTHPSGTYFWLNPNLVNTTPGHLTFGMQGSLVANSRPSRPRFFFLSLALLPAYCTNTYSALTKKSERDDQNVSILAPMGSATREWKDKDAELLLRYLNTALESSESRKSPLDQNASATPSPSHQAPPRSQGPAPPRP